MINGIFLASCFCVGDLQEMYCLNMATGNLFSVKIWSLWHLFFKKTILSTLHTGFFFVRKSVKFQPQEKKKH